MKAQNTSKNKQETILSLVDVKKYFVMNKNFSQKAVDDVSINLYHHEVLGLVGESGCGKTTLGRSIIGLYKITDGQIFYKDELINSKKIKKPIALSKEIQMIFQDPYTSLNPRMTIFDIVAEGLKIQGEKDKQVIYSKVISILNKVGISKENITRYPHELSGGQRQRVGIARALIMNPKILIADEPVSALDVSIQAQILNLLSSLREELDLSILFIAHNLGVVKYFCDRIAVMYYGKIVELADKDELFNHPLHPYTKSLLSAICEPDPNKEKNKSRILYSPKENDLTREYKLREVRKNHFVYCSKEESEALKNEK